MKNKILNLLKLIFSEPARRKLRLLQKAIVYFWRRQVIRIPIAINKPIKIIVGAAITNQKGWYSTNEEWLDITCADDWENVFHGKKLLKNVVAEHVFEHLTPEQTRKALHLIVVHMQPGSAIRIAVPDGYHPEPEYLRHVGIAGIGADASDHKQLLNCDSLINYLAEAGLTPKLKEGYLTNGDLVQQPLHLELGLVFRSRSNKANIATRAGWDFIDANTSLVVDGIFNK